MNMISSQIAAARKRAKLSQAEVAKAFSDRGYPISSQSISAWEKKRAFPNAEQFLILCDILRIDDIRDAFHRTEVATIFTGLNEEGKDKLYEYATLLKRSGLYTPLTPVSSITPVFSHGPSSGHSLDGIHSSGITPLSARRTLKIYHLAVSAGTGQFLD